MVSTIIIECKPDSIRALDTKELIEFQCHLDGTTAQIKNYEYIYYCNGPHYSI